MFKRVIFFFKRSMKKKQKTIVSAISQTLRAKAILSYTGAIVCLALSSVLVLIGIREFTQLSILIPRNLPTTGDEATANALFSQLISMQSNTLAVVSIAIAMAATILSVLSILQWKRSEDIRKQYKKTNEKVQNFFAMAVVQSLSEEKYYVQADKLLAEELQQTQDLIGEDKDMLLFSSIQILLAKEKDAKIISRKQDLTDDAIEAWASVASICSEILKIRYAFSAIQYLVKIKYVYAKYQLCRLVRQADRKAALQHIKDADWMLHRISESEMDPYGHINNLRGLVYLWMCKCLEDHEEYGKEHTYIAKYDKAEQFFLKSLKDAEQMDPQADFSAFYNHVGVAQINKARCLLFTKNKSREEKANALDAAARTFNTLVAQNPRYAKAYLNMAHICYLKLLLAIGIDNPVFFLQNIELWALSNDITEAINLINNEKERLNYAYQMGETLPDVGYRMFEILTIELVIRNAQPDKTKGLPFIPCSILNAHRDSEAASNPINKLIPDKIVENILVCILKKYDVIDASVESLKSFQADMFVTEDPCLGFLEPWRNYAFWKQMRTNSHEKEGWKETITTLNKQLAQQREKKVKAWTVKSKALMSSNQSSHQP